LIDLDQVDAVLRPAINAGTALQLIEADTAAKTGKIPGLVWKEKRGRVRHNEISGEQPSSNINITESYRGAINQIKRYRDFGGYASLLDLLTHPEVSIYEQGSEPSPLFGPGKPQEAKSAPFREPEDVFEDALQLCRHSPALVRVRGDIRSPGGHFAERFLSLLQHRSMPNKFRFELNGPAPAFFIQEMARAAPRFHLLMIPGSHDAGIRKRLGQEYTNAELESTVGEALKARAGSVEVRFLVGLPGQTAASVEETSDYSEFLLRRFDGDPRLNFTVAPFRCSPEAGGWGSLTRLGFKPRFEHFSDYTAALSLPGWQQRLEYSGGKMTPVQAAEATYKALIHLTRLKAKYGQIPQRRAEEAAENFARGMQMSEWLDGLAQHTHGEELAGFAHEIEEINKFENPKKRIGLPIFSRPRNLMALWRAVFVKYASPTNDGETD
jgi:hypothetical protein